MADHDLHRVEELFQAAADLPAEGRASFLDEQCDGDLELRRHIERLLAQLDDDRLKTPAPPRAIPSAPLLAASITEGPGSIIGRYKLLQEIGEGGFGAVYMAEQQEPVVRKVALKIIKLGMDTREVVARFEAERQALAMMDHPNIAKVLDGGATDSGRPYFVMELVRGVPITEYCDRKDLTPRERLELFGLVCHAVQHAHQKGVIHRDLKPSNVLVTQHEGTAVPKIIDFGVAKAMHTRLTQKTLFTRYEQFIGTPAYMSPEQAEMSALDVDTRTDIYSLGVLLYELLTGSTPFETDRFTKAGLAEIQRIIREEQPPRPSVRISASGSALVATRRGLDLHALSRRLRGDLDWIVMKALEKERARRYATANELAEDIARHLRQEPVLASPPRATYRLAKFLARNRPAVVSAALVALALVGGIIGTTAGMLQADRSAKVAEEQAESALTALDFLVSTLSLTNPSVALAPDVSVRALLDLTAAEVAQAFADVPWAEVRVRSTIGQAYVSLAEVGLAEPHLMRAVELVDELTDGRGPGSAPLDTLGYDAGDFYTTLWALTNVAFSLERNDSFAVAARARGVGLDHVATWYPEVSEALRTFTVAVTQDAWSLEPDAMEGVPELFEEAVSISDAAMPADDPLWTIVSDTFLACGYTVWYTPNEHMAELFFRQALTIQRREMPADHPAVATSVRLLVDVLNKQGRSKESESLIRDSLEKLRRVHGEGDLHIAAAESTLGENLLDQGRYDEAEPYLLESHAVILEKTKNESNWAAVESFTRLVRLYEGWDRPDRAQPYRDSLANTCAGSSYVMAWAVTRWALEPTHAPIRELLEQLNERCGGISYLVAFGTQQGDEILPILERLSDLRTTLMAEDDPRTVAVARTLMALANALDPVVHLDERQAMAGEALAMLRNWEETHPLPLAEAMALRASTTREEDAVAARRLAREAFLLIREAGLSGNWFTAASEIRIARSLLEQGAYQEAEWILRPCYDVFAAQLGGRHTETLTARALLFDLYTAWDRPEDARAFAAPDAG
jgi:serine/threonine protein kinase